MFTSDKRAVAEERLRQLQDELSRAQADRITKQSRYEMTARGPADVQDLPTQTSLHQYHVSLTDLRRQRAELATTYTPEHAKVRRLDAQIAELESALRSEERNIVNRIENDHNQAIRREALLSAQLANQSRLVTELSDRTVQYNILQRDVDSNRQLYDLMLQRSKEAVIATGIRASNFRVLDPAPTPDYPFTPKPLINCVLGLATGLFIGLLFVFAREQGDSTVREPGEAQQYLNMAELGVLFHDRDGHALLRSPEQSRPGVLERVSGTNLWRSDDQLNEQLQSVRLFWAQLSTGTSPTMQSAVVLESLRSTVTSVVTSTVRGDDPAVIVVSSAEPREGKTTVVTHLGLMIAQIGRRVLLIDADFRKPRLHQIFGISDDIGFSTLLRSGPLTDQTLRDAVQPTAIPGLDVITSGGLSNSAHLLHSPRLAHVLQGLKKYYDIIVIDTPPALQIADARLVGQVSDGMILVVRSGVTSKQAAAAVTQRFQNDGIHMIGMILNDWNPNASARGYYGSYDYSSQR
jgi:capsular exopolysaccharide synthesis family protein